MYVSLDVDEICTYEETIYTKYVYTYVCMEEDDNKNIIMIMSFMKVNTLSCNKRKDNILIYI